MICLLFFFQTNARHVVSKTCCFLCFTWSDVHTFQSVLLENRLISFILRSSPWTQHWADLKPVHLFPSQFFLILCIKKYPRTSALTVCFSSQLLTTALSSLRNWIHKPDLQTHSAHNELLQMGQRSTTRTSHISSQKQHLTLSAESSAVSLFTSQW